MQSHPVGVTTMISNLHPRRASKIPTSTCGAQCVLPYFPTYPPEKVPGNTPLQVVRGEDLSAELRWVVSLESEVHVGVAAGYEHGAVREKEGGRVVHAGNAARLLDLSEPDRKRRIGGKHSRV